MLLMRGAYYLGLDRLFYWLNSRAKRIVTFHNVIPGRLLPAEDASCICFSDKLFERIVDEIGTRFRFSTDLFDPSTCTITFDDGYANQLEVAGPILRQRGIAAVLFLAQSLVNAKEPTGALVVDRLLLWTARVPLSRAHEEWGGQFESRDELWTRIIRPAFVADMNRRGLGLIERLDRVYSFAEVFSRCSADYLRLRLRGVTSEQIREFEKEGWLFAHHTVSHFPLSALDEESAAAEIQPPEGKRDLPFGYPYGETDSVSAKDVAIAERLGYPCAVANTLDFSSLQGRYFMPRFMFFTPDRYRIHFELSGLKYFLKYRRLLPIYSK